MSINEERVDIPSVELTFNKTYESEEEFERKLAELMRKSDELYAALKNSSSADSGYNENEMSNDYPRRSR